MIYEYCCLVCNKKFDVEQSIKDSVGVECFNCKVFCTNRLISGGLGFILKGSGWAKSGYSK